LGIWDKVKGQSVLGEDDFVERFLDHVKGYEKIREIPRGQRFLGRPKLEKLCGQGMMVDRGLRNEAIFSAVMEWGYSQREIADYLGLHYSTVSRLMRNRKISRNKT